MIAAARHSGRIAALLTLVCLGLAYLAYARLEPRSAEFSPVALDNGTSVAADAIRPTEDLAMVPLSTFSEISERPLFSPSRRPLELALTADDEPSNASVDAYLLQGTTSSAAGRKALVLVRGANQPLWVSEGERLDGWLIERINPDGLVLSGQGLRKQLTLRDHPELRRKARKRSPQEKLNSGRDQSHGPADQTGEPAAPAADGEARDEAEPES